MARFLQKGNVKVGIYGFTGCAGDQLVIIHTEDKLLDFFASAEFKSFLMAQSNNDDNCDLDVAFVEGSISTEEEAEEIKEIRKRAKILVAIGTCACYGGVQAQYYGDGHWEERFKMVYPESVELTKPLESKPISDYVKVDFTVPGCPVDANQILHAFSKAIHGIPPELYKFPVCTECKWQGNDCLLNKGIFCLGPITTAGCGAACPTNNVPCDGCFGPYYDANYESYIKLLLEKGFSKEEIIRKIRIFGGAEFAKKFKEIEEALS